MDFQSSNSKALARRGGGTGKLPPVQSLDPKLAALCNRYFAIDLNNLDSMSDEQLSAYADMAKDAERWKEIIPILEQHFQKILDGQQSREQFYASVQKSAAQTGKRIDNSVLQTFLASKGYDAHLQLMAQKAHNGAGKIDAEHRSAVQLELTDFQSYLQLVQWKHQRSEKQIAQRLPQVQRNAQLAEAEGEAQQYRKDLLTQGSASANQNKQRRGGFFGGMFDFFSGK